MNTLKIAHTKLQRVDAAQNRPANRSSEDTSASHSASLTHPPPSPLLLSTSAASVSSPFRTQLTYNAQPAGRVVLRECDSENKENNNLITTNKRRSNMMMYFPDCTSLWKEIEQRDLERDEMMASIRLLTEKNQNVKDALKREESVKHHQITIMKKTHETQLEIKNSLIRNLEDIIDEQEARIFNLESHIAGIRNLSPKSTKELGGVKRLQVLIDELTNKNIDLTEKLMNEEKLRENAEQKLANHDENCSLNLYSHKFYESATDSEKQLKKVEEERTDLKEHLRILKNQLEQVEQAYQTLKIESERTEVKYLEKNLTLEHKENETRRQLVDEKSSLQRELDSVKNELFQIKLKDNEMKAKAEANDSLLENIKDRLNAEQNERKQNETVIADMKEVCNKQELEIRKWHSAVLELEKQMDVQTSQLEKELEDKTLELDQLKHSFSRIRRDSTTWQQRHADTIISLDCFRASLRHLREEQAELLQTASEFPAEIQQVLVNVRQQISRKLSISMSDLVTKYKHEMRLRKEYHNQLIEIRGNIRVFCRVRPVIPFDTERISVMNFDAVDDSLLFVQNDGRCHSFTLDKIFAEVRPLLTSCVDGYNVCIFAYGQTGSGKTYTMDGPSDDPGINQRALVELFAEANARKPDWKFRITVSMLEIYNENIRDLLTNDSIGTKLDVKMTSDGTLGVPGLTCLEVESVSEVNKIFQIGRRARVTAATILNDVSSRSHAVLNVTVVGYNAATKLKTFGRLNLVDLAGSERVSKSAASGDRLKEAQSINKSLSALGDVIWALRNKSQHVPFRNSKLTYLLQDCLSGDSKTVMVVQVAPLPCHVNETLCSLNFAKRVRSVELGQASARTALLSNGHENGEFADVSPALIRSPSRLKTKVKK